MIPVALYTLDSFKLIEWLGKISLGDDAILLFGSLQTKCYISSKMSLGLGSEQMKCINYTVHLTGNGGDSLGSAQFYHLFRHKVSIRQKVNDVRSTYVIDRNDGGMLWEWRDGSAVHWGGRKVNDFLIPQFVG